MHPSTVPGTRWASPKSPVLRAWECLMDSAVGATRCGQLVEAQGHYERALALSQALYDQLRAPGNVPANAPDDHLAAFVVTRLNLADLHCQRGQPEFAAHGLCLAHRALLSLTRDDGVAAPVRQAAFRHARETHAALIGHLNVHGDGCPNVLHTLRVGGMPFSRQGSDTLH